MVFFRQILGAFAQLENSMRVSTFADGRQRAQKTTKRQSMLKKKKVEGRKNMLELYPGLPTALNKILRKPFAKKIPKTGPKKPLKLDQISQILADGWGIVTQRRKEVRTGRVLKGGNPLNKAAVARWLAACDKM